MFFTPTYRQIIAKRLMFGWKLDDEVLGGAGEATFCRWFIRKIDLNGEISLNANQLGLLNVSSDSCFYAGGFLMPESKTDLTPASQLLGGLMDVYLTGFDGIATAQGKVFFIARHC